MGSIRDLTGIRFERLVVQFREGTNAHGAAKWNCLCDCGNSVVTVGRALVLVVEKAVVAYGLKRLGKNNLRICLEKGFHDCLLSKKLGKHAKG